MSTTLRNPVQRYRYGSALAKRRCKTIHTRQRNNGNARFPFSNNFYNRAGNSGIDDGNRRNPTNA